MKAQEIVSVANVFSNPLRFGVFQAIERRPCSTREEIAESLGAHVGVVGFHVRALAAFEAVSACEDGKLTANTDAVRAALDDLGEGPLPP
jgi:predicted transcriptional regulator